MPLKVSDGIGAWIKDFQKSDAPQFKNSSHSERRDQAIAAYLGAKRGDKNEAYDNPPFTPDPPKKNVKNSDGTRQSPMSRARQLAKKARDSQKTNENNSAPQTAAHRRAQSGSRYSDIMKKRQADNEKARQALKDPDHNPAWANSKSKLEARDPSKSGGSGYDLYHKDFSSAMKHAYGHAKKLGVDIDPKEIDDKVASGPRKPSAGKTNSYRLMGKDGKKGVQIQVANLDNKKYELNMYKESVEIHEVSSSVAKRAMKKRVEKQAASYTTQASYNRRADNARAKRDALLKKADALPDHHKPRSSGGDYFKGSSEHEKLTKKADDHNFAAHHYSNKAKEAGERGDKQGNKIGRSQDRAYPKLGKALKANPDNRRAQRIGHTQVDKMRDKHFATTTDYNPAGKEKIKGKQHSQYPKKEETVLELKKYDKNADYRLLNRLSQKAKTGNLTPAEKSQMANAKSRLRNYGFSEEVEIHEAVLSGRDYKVKDGRVHISKANFTKVHKDYKNATKGKERMTVLDPKSQATASMPVRFVESVERAYEIMKPTKSMNHGIEAIKKTMKVDHGTATKLARQVMDKVKKGEFKEGTADRYKVIKKIGDKLNKEKKKAERDAMRHAKRDNEYQTESSASDEGARAASQGQSYSSNPYPKGSPNHLEWSKGHNKSRARRLNMGESKEEFTLKHFHKNEDENRHTENGVKLVNKFGTSTENIKMGGIAARHNMKGSINRKDQQDRDALVKKYYPKLKETTSVKKTNEATQFKVDIDGLPPTFIQGKSVGEIMANLRKIVKQPSLIKDVERVTDYTVKKTYRAKSQGREVDEAANPDEGSMALTQLEFIEYAAEELSDHIKKGGDFPEWMQNKLTKAHTTMEGLHSSMGDHGGDDDENEKDD
jgi:hypothetical protein